MVFEPARAAAELFSRRLAVRDEESSVFAMEFGPDADEEALRQGIAGATMAVITGPTGHSLSRTGVTDLLSRLEGIGLTPEFVGRARQSLEGGPDAAVAVFRGVSAPRVDPAPSSFRVVAVLTAYNEADIIRHTVRHLRDNGVGVYLINNWSTDSTLDLVLSDAGDNLVGHETFPPEGPSKSFEWTRLLTRVEEVVRDLDADWVISNDADEFRFSPWPGVTIRDALYHAEQQGYSAVNHCYLNFQLTQDTYNGDTSPVEHLSWFRPERGEMYRLNSWRKSAAPSVELAWSGNHAVRFPGMSVFPYNFLCKHYPIRSLEQGSRKVFKDRLPRFQVTERLQGWHSHYDHMDASKLLVPTQGLFHFDSNFHEDFLLERLVGVGLEREPPRVTNKIRAARLLRRLGLLDKVLSVRWRASGRAARR